jgi:hypothetical protein
VVSIRASNDEWMWMYQTQTVGRKADETYECHKCINDCNKLFTFFPHFQDTSFQRKPLLSYKKKKQQMVKSSTTMSQQVCYSDGNKCWNMHKYSTVVHIQHLKSEWALLDGCRSSLSIIPCRIWDGLQALILSTYVRSSLSKFGFTRRLCWRL